MAKRTMGPPDGASPATTHKRHWTKNRPTVEKLCYRVNTLADLLDMSRDAIYDAINAKKLDARRFGNMTLITGASVKRFLDELPATKSDANDV